jgi:hypothetical protein
MAKYLILYRSPTPPRDQMANATPEQMKAGLDAWMTWAGKAGDAVTDLGSPVEHTTHVGPGSAASGGADICGYSIVQAGSAEAAAGTLDGHPHLEMPGNSIEVLELISMPGM